MKTALVTGAARRIGAAIAQDLAKSGFNVAIQYASSEDEAHSLADGLRQQGVKAVAIEADLLDVAACGELFQKAASAVGHIDVLVNNASIFQNDDLLDIDWELWDQHFAIHVKAPSALSALMAGQSETDVADGLIVNVVDQRVWRLNPNFYSYTLSKAALWTATQTLAQRLAPRFRVNAIGPGPTLANERQNPADFDKQVAGIALKRSPDLSEFGNTIRYLYENRSITGQMIALDGGQHLAWETPDVAGITE